MRYTNQPFFDAGILVPKGTPEYKLSPRCYGWAVSAGVLEEFTGDASEAVEDKRDHDAGDDADDEGTERDGIEGDGIDRTETLASVGVSDKAVELLAAADPPITTPADARAYLAEHGSFSAIKGIGRATSNDIVAALS